jgi:hypothetical protein
MQKPLTKAQLRALQNFKRGARYPITGRGSIATAEALKKRGLIEYDEGFTPYGTIRLLDLRLTDKGRAFVARLS